MQMLQHHCICTYNTPILYSPLAFSQNIACSHCGAISTGINVQGKAKEDASMQQDELARLFSANMNLSHVTAQPVQTQAPQEQEQAPKQIVYASQHYTHSHHVPLRSTSEPAMETQTTCSDLAAVLLRNSIDPTLLFPSQMDLFQNADDDQRLRLLELWRISPRQAVKVTQQQQNELAQQEAIQQHQQQLEQSMGTANAEPYMSSGYEMMARREYEESMRADTPVEEMNKYNQATDPVYNNTGNNGLWQKQVGSVSDMENNYGAYAYRREYGLDMSYGDEEMVM
ncbi:hypothetical protein PTNB73_05825 [Pyrenophora teres f. teres]|nr:hypothetical protein PTNB73_05825 [Pyrenophora teres f. teres]